MKAMLSKGDESGLWHVNAQGERIAGKNADMSGNCTGLRGECTGLSGNCSGLRGDCSGLSGDCSGLIGDLDECELTDAERKGGVDIATLCAADAQ